MITHSELTIRLMNVDDFELMVKWLNDEKVLEFYEEPPTNLDRVITKYGPRVEGKHYVTPCIVEYESQPIGYIQYYQIQEQDLERYGYSDNETIYGIDQFIGEIHLWGKGIGTRMIRMLLDHLHQSQDVSKVVLEVKKMNGRAISSYKKCGFRILKDLNEDYYLMEWG
ncbi:MAG TPA: GNAT family N-acetyltransferase [Ureibacillus sp.]|nr:GNAT family N-acetyltransferase [Ureibacillus sp.]